MNIIFMNIIFNLWNKHCSHWNQLEVFPGNLAKWTSDQSNRYSTESTEQKVLIKIFSCEVLKLPWVSLIMFLIKLLKLIWHGLLEYTCTLGFWILNLWAVLLTFWPHITNIFYRSCVQLNKTWINTVPDLYNLTFKSIQLKNEETIWEIQPPSI